ncbi:hypothetical protein J7L48_05520 [bacterium]|nr:hypothetical protein [bacterium]
MKKGIITIIFLIFFGTMFSKQLTNYLGNEIFPVKRTNLYFIKYSKSSTQIMEKAENGEVEILKDDFILPTALDISYDERFILYVSNKEDSRGTLKLINRKKHREKIIELGKSINGARFINNDLITYSADGIVYTYNLRTKEKLKIGNGIHPTYYKYNIYFANGYLVKKYSLQTKELTDYYKNDHNVYFPSFISQRLYFLENYNISAACFIYENKKIPLLRKGIKVTSLNAINGKLFISEKLRNFDIFELDLFGEIPLFQKELDIEKYPFKSEANKLFAYKRLMLLKGSSKSNIKNSFLLSLKIKDIGTAKKYLKELKKELSENDHRIYEILFGYVFKKIHSKDIETYVNKNNDNGRLMLIYATLLFNEGNFVKAVKIFKELSSNDSQYYLRFSSYYNLMKVYEKTGNIYEEIRIWKILSSNIPIYLKSKYEDMVLATFATPLLDAWEKLNILNDLNNKKFILLKANVLYQLQFYDKALDGLKDKNEDEAKFLRFKIYLKRKNLNMIRNTYFQLKDNKEKARIYMLKNLNIKDIFLRKDIKYLEVLTKIFPNDLRIIFWYYYYLKEYNPVGLVNINKNLNSKHELYKYKKLLITLFLEKRLKIGFIKDANLRKWENSFYYFAYGMYNYNHKNFKKAKWYLLNLSI